MKDKTNLEKVLEWLGIVFIGICVSSLIFFSIKKVNDYRKYKDLIEWRLKMLEQGETNKESDYGFRFVGFRNEVEAAEDCQKRAVRLFGVKSISMASSTNDDFSTYDCYGVKYTKIPKEKAKSEQL